MLTVNKVIPQARGLAPVLTRRAPTVELDWDVRQKSRFDATDSSGRHLGVFLPRGTLVRGGDVLVGEDGSLVVVKAAAQAVLTVRHCPDHGRPFDLLRAAYHLGNRHVALELQPDRLQLEPDHVLADLLRQMHLIVAEALAPFEPEGGAYQAGAAAAGTGDRHGHGPAHEHEHEHEHEHFPDTDPGTGRDTSPAPKIHQQHDHGHHDLSGHRLAAGPQAPAAPVAPHVHGPGCGHGHSH